MGYLSLVADRNTLSGHDPEVANTKRESVTQEIPLNQRLQRLGIRELWWNVTPLLKLFWSTHVAKRKSSNLDEKATSVKLPRGKTLPRSRIRNDHEDVILEEEDIRRWHLAEDLLIKYKATGEDTRSGDTVTDRSSNWPPVDIDPKRLDKSLFIAFNASGILYGGLHLLAWNAAFRTITEQSLWRQASSFIATFVPTSTMLMLMENLFFKMAEDGRRRYMAVASLERLFYRFKIWYVLFVLSMLTYFTARVYLVVECFISLSHSPMDVYILPEGWAYIPHIT